MLSQQYVGVTGAKTLDEALWLADAFTRHGFSRNATHIGMIGYLISTKSLAGLPMKNPRYPAFAEIPAMLNATNGRALNMLHHGTMPQNFGHVREDIETAFETAGIYETGLCRALQLNLQWPDPELFRDVLNKFPEMRMVLSVHPQQLRPTEISDRVAQYKGLASDLLIDPSQGEGVAIDLSTAVQIYTAIRAKDNGMLIGFAGGLGGEDSEERIRALKDKMPSGNLFSVDAEKALRDESDSILDRSKVERYLKASSIALIQK